MAAAAALLLLAAGGAGAQTFNIDLYVSVEAVPGEPMMTGYHEDGSVVVPRTAVGENGVAPFDPAFEGADGYRQSLEAAFGRANGKFEAAGVRFKIRNIFFVPTDHPGLATHYRAEQNEYDLGVKDGKSAMLGAFAEMTKGTTDAFTMLVAPITVDPESGDPESGRGVNFGTVSIVDTGTALRGFDNGSIIIHELAHNLGIVEHAHDPLTEAVARQSVATGRRPNPVLLPKQIATIRKEVASGRYDAMRAPDEAAPKSAARPKGTSSSKSASPSKGGTARKAAGSGQTSAPRRAETSAGRAAADTALRIGIGVGLGVLGGGLDRRERHRDHHRGRH